MPVEMEREGRRLMASSKISDFNKSPMSTQKSYSIKKNFTDHEQAFRSSGSAIEDLFSKKKGKMSPNLKGKDVLNRLDSLVAGDKQEVTSECKGILKQKSTQLNTRRKKRHIRFPDSKKIQEIIGWDGGEEYYGASSSTSGDSSDEEEQKNILSKSSRNEELTTEERNVINITRRNTSYNSHAPNLLKDNPISNLDLNPPSQGLGIGKSKTPPLVVVSPFASKQTSEKTSKVQSMVKEKMNESREKEEKKYISSKLQSNKIGQISSNNKIEIVSDKLNSDGGSNDSSSPPSSSDGESSGSMSPRQEVIRSPVLSNSAAIKIDVNSCDSQSKTNIEISGCEEPSDNDSVAKSPSASRLSFLSSTLSSTANMSKLTLPVETVSKSDTISSITISTTSSSTTVTNALSIPDAVETDSKTEEYTSVYVNSASSLKGYKEAESLVDESRKMSKPQLNRSKTSSVKLTRSSPYTLSSSSSTSILKGTPKPSVVVRKPPVSKDKPKLPIKPTKLLNSKFGQTHHGKINSQSFQQPTVDRKTSIKIEGIHLNNKLSLKDSDTAEKSDDPPFKETESSEVTISKSSEIDFITVNGKSTSAMAECYTADCDVQNALVIDVKASSYEDTDAKENTGENNESINVEYSSVMVNERTKTINNDSTDMVSDLNKTISSIPKGDSSFVDKGSNVQSKNREELLKAIRESLSDKLLSSNNETMKDNNKQTDSNNANTNGEKDIGKDSAKLKFNDSEKNNNDNRDETSKHYRNYDSNDVNSNFQATRATIASALGGQVKYSKNSTRQSFAKRQAPKTPAPQPPVDKNELINKEENETDKNIGNNPSANEESGVPSLDDDKIDQHNDSVELNTEQPTCILSAPTKDLPPEPIANKDAFRERSYTPKKPLSPPPPISFKQSHPPPPKSVLVAAARHSSMKSEMSPNRSAIKKGVQFNPETTMMKLPDSMDLHVTNHHNLIKCNRWLKDGSTPTNSVPKVVESSFTGQPIQVNNSHPAPPSQTTAMSPSRVNNPSNTQVNQHLQPRSSPHHSSKADQHSHLLSPVVSYAQNAPSKVSV